MRPWLTGLISVITLSVVVGVPGRWMGPSRYQAFMGAVQAIGLGLALAIAWASLQNDRTARRVDRTIRFHEELVQGELGEARHRLVMHLREHGLEKDGQKRVLQPKEGDLRLEAGLSEYSFGALRTPDEDRVLILRYFERVNAARVAGIVSPDLLHRLIGPHALWWDAALWNLAHGRAHRSELLRLAKWVGKWGEDHQMEASEYLPLWSYNLTEGGGCPDFSTWPTSWAL